MIMSIAISHFQQESSASIAERIVALAFRRRLTKAALAKSIGLSPAAFYNKMNGTSNWQYPELAGIAATLETSVAYLIGEVDDDTPLRKTQKAPTHESQGLRAASAELVAGAGFEPTTSGL